jgi:hypothetical protein
VAVIDFCAKKKGQKKSVMITGNPVFIESQLDWLPLVVGSLFLLTSQQKKLGQQKKRGPTSGLWDPSWTGRHWSSGDLKIEQRNHYAPFFCGTSFYGEPAGLVATGRRGGGKFEFFQRKKERRRGLRHGV